MGPAELKAAIAAAKAVPAIKPHNGYYLAFSHPSIPREEVIEALVNLEMLKRRRKQQPK